METIKDITMAKYAGDYYDAMIGDIVWFMIENRFHIKIDGAEHSMLNIYATVESINDGMAIVVYNDPIKKEILIREARYINQLELAKRKRKD